MRCLQEVSKAWLHTAKVGYEVNAHCLLISYVIETMGGNRLTRSVSDVDDHACNRTSEAPARAINRLKLLVKVE